jgi:hypothetical protein
MSGSLSRIAAVAAATGFVGVAWLPGVDRCHSGRFVASIWPSGPSWKARPGGPSMPDATPMPQVRPFYDRLLLTARNRQAPILRHAEGTADEDEPCFT